MRSGIYILCFRLGVCPVIVIIFFTAIARRESPFFGASGGD